MHLVTLSLIVAGVIACLALSAFACGDYMSSTDRSRLHPLLQLLAIPGMLLMALVFLGPTVVFSWWPRNKKPRGHEPSGLKYFDETNQTHVVSEFPLYRAELPMEESDTTACVHYSI